MHSVPASVRRMAQRFRAAGHEIYVVGGAVRDALLGLSVADYDFATSATPEEVQRLFRRTIPTGIQHGTVTVLFQNDQFEVTTFRVDGRYSDHRRPEEVSFTRSLLEDLRRRDFTINAIALDPVTEAILDPFDGQADLKKKTICTVGNSRDRFEEDALRMLRAVRFSVTLSFQIEASTAEGIRTLAPTLTHVSAERIRQELEKMMGAPRPSRGWRLLDEYSLLPVVCPELIEDRMRSTETPEMPDVFSHLLTSCDCAPADDPILRWAALLHDVGKPRCASFDQRGLNFIGHDRVSADVAAEVLDRLRFPRSFSHSVAHLILHHMFGYTSEWSDTAIRRFVSRVGREEVFRLTALSRIDLCGKIGTVHPAPLIDELEHRIHCLLSSTPPLSVKELAINGRDLMEHLGLGPGQHIGLLLQECLDTAIADPKTNTPERLKTIATRFYNERMSAPKDSPEWR